MRDEAVERVKGGLRRHRGVGFLSVVGDVARVDAEHVRVGDLHRRRVHHQRCVDVVEGALVQQQLLAADVLLRRRAQHHEPHVGRRQGALETDCAAQPGGGDQVVPAGVADARQRVVLQEVSDSHRALAPGPPERRLDSVDAAFDGESLRLQRVAEQLRRARLLERQLRVLVDVAADLDQRRRSLSNGHLRPLFRFVDAHVAPPCGTGHFSAIAFGGEPTPPGTFSGAEVSRNS